MIPSATSDVASCRFDLWIVYIRANLYLVAFRTHISSSFNNDDVVHIPCACLNLRIAHAAFDRHKIHSITIRASCVLRARFINKYLGAPLGVGRNIVSCYWFVVGKYEFVFVCSKCNGGGSPRFTDIGYDVVSDAESVKPHTWY